jgi:RNA polymerase sigma factor (sigma-70 family)
MPDTPSSRTPKQERLEAFEAVVAHYEAALIRYAARVLNDADAAQDVAQETFLRLLRHWREPLEVCPKLSNWLYRVAHNCAVDHIRRTARRHLLHREAAGAGPDHAPPDRGADFRISEAAARAAEALQTLNLRERQLVILKVYEDKSYREIADITGLSTGNVGYILHHAMKKLAAALGGKRET